jgi:hypothetical protein
LVRIATVLSSQPWESNLVALARTTGSVRVVTRAYEPHEILQADPDVVVVGAETAWLTPARMRTWKAAGLRFIGMYPFPDRPAAERLRLGGADEILPDDSPSAAVLRAARAVAAGPAETRPTGKTVAVVGPTGSPGVTEMALAAAWHLATNTSSILIEVPPAIPSLAIRLRLPLQPNVMDVLDGVARTGMLAHRPPSAGRPTVVPGAYRSNPVPWDTTTDLLEALQRQSDWVVIDAGSAPAADPLLRFVDLTLLVVEASPSGLVRAARYVAAWEAAMPMLIVNRVPPSAGSEAREDVTRAARLCIGLEPSLLIDDDPSIARASRLGLPPSEQLVGQLGRMPLPEPGRHVVPS